MLKGIAKYLAVFLVFATLITAVVSQGCSTGASQAAPQPGATGAPSSQQSSQPANQQGRPSRDPQFMKNVLAKVADTLGAPADAVTQAYEQARSAIVPQSPPATPPTGGQSTPPPPGQGWSGRPPGSDSRTGQMSAIFDKMSSTLNIPADQISAAWQAAMTELRPSNSNNTSPAR